MKFTLSWLKTYLETDATLEEISAKLTDIGLEVEEIVDNSEILKPFTVAEIISAEKHPNADKLQICQVETGKGEDKPRQIVCGAPNARAGIKVALADIGVEIPTNGLKIKQAKIRDIDSSGMLCSESELGLSDESEGIMELPADAVIGKPFAPFVGADDPLIEIAITPNRGDCLGVYGVARDLAASGLGKLSHREGVLATAAIQKSSQEQKSLDCFAPLAMTEKSKIHVLSRKITNLKNVESPEWLKRRLISIGSTPKSALIDISNFILFDLGRPSHVYDADKVAGALKVSVSKGGEEFTDLKDVEHKLPENAIIISDDNGIEGVAGIIGGQRTAISDGTSNIIIEVANFDPIAIAYAGRKLGIESDARYRFERKLDSKFLEKGIEAITALIIELCGTDKTEVSKVAEVGEEFAGKDAIELKAEDISNRLGIEIANYKEILEGLSFEISGDKFTPPSWRNDISIKEDLIEEVARVHGYNEIPSEPLAFAPVKDARSIRQNKILNIAKDLKAYGYKETVSLSFIAPKLAKKFIEDAGDLIEVANPISENLSIMRPSILASLLNVAKENVANNVQSLSLYETGAIFAKDKRQFNQEISAAGLIYGNVCEKSHVSPELPATLFEIKWGVEKALSNFMKVDNLQISADGVPSYYHPARSGAVKLGKNVIAYFGELHPKLLKDNKIKAKNVHGFEILLDNLPEPRAAKSTAFKAFKDNNLPTVYRDFAFELDVNVAAGELIKSVKGSDKKSISNVSIFDLYQGENIAEGKKSIALKVELQPEGETFTAEQINDISEKIISNVNSRLGGILRS